MKGLVLVLFVPALLILLGTLCPFVFTVTWVSSLVAGFLLMLATFVYCRRHTRWMFILPAFMVVGVVVLIALGPAVRAVIYPILNGLAWGGAAGYTAEVLNHWNDWIELTASASAPRLAHRLRQLRRK